MPLAVNGSAQLFRCEELQQCSPWPSQDAVGTQSARSLYQENELHGLNRSLEIMFDGGLLL